MTTKSDVDILMDARDTIMDPKDWCQGVLVQNEWGQPLPGMEETTSDKARRWCAVGAAYKALGLTGIHALDMSGWHSENNWPGWLRALHHASRHMGFDKNGSRMGPAHINDRLGHDAVMEMYDQALRFAKEAEENAD